MAIDEYIASADFLLFKDKVLYDCACEAVKNFLHAHKPVKNSQLHSIETIIQAAGLKGLDQLSANQTKKNTSEENKSFWEFVHGLLFEPASGPSLQCGLRFQVKSELARRGFLVDEACPEKPDQKKAKRTNKDTVERVINLALSTYFEHFNCHYFYQTMQGGLP